MVCAGGTPYAGLRTRDVLGRIMRGGLRLPRTPYMSEALYQLMLACWMSDPDERPAFASVNATLTDLAAEVDQVGGTHTANEGLMRIQCKCRVPIDVFPEMNLRSLVISITEFKSQSTYIYRVQSSVWLLPNY
jgi:hypothetical protein